MIPIRDDQPRFSTPAITYFLIALNSLIFLFEASLDPRSLQVLLFRFGLVPARVTAALTGSHPMGLAAIILPMFTSMFLHGSFAHVAGNMLFLWIFGDNVEDYLGHLPYLIFYLVCGLVAMAAQIALTPDLQAPNIGASGAIAGILGAYFVLYPKARVLVWFPIMFIFQLPAWIMLGFWFVYQFFSGAATSLAATAGTTDSGIAFWAHVGGFVAGMLLIKVFPERKYRLRYGTW
jgi:membrane associated rhomboid family serine protease